MTPEESNGSSQDASADPRSGDDGVNGANGAARPLVERFDVALLDLDGVVYVGTDPVPGVADAITAVRRRGMRVTFVTNNASRSPADVAKLLGSVGVDAVAADVVTAAQAGARVLAERLPRGAAVLIVGGDALRDEVEAVGLTPVHSADDHPAGVIQGYHPSVGYRDLAEATVAVRAGAVWIVTNGDLTIPSARGILPGNGALVQVVRTATGTPPVVTGKPEPALHQESVRRSGARRPIVVGDRLDTDIEGAARAGCPSLLVLSGVTTPSELLAADAGHRPTYLAENVSGLLHAHRHPDRRDGGWRLCGWFAAEEDDALTLSWHGTAAQPDRLDALRVLCAASWATGSADGRGGVRVRASGDDATAATESLQLRS